MGGASSFPKLRGAATSAAGGRRPAPSLLPQLPKKAAACCTLDGSFVEARRAAFGRVPRRARLRRDAAGETRRMCREFLSPAPDGRCETGTPSNPRDRIDPRARDRLGELGVGDDRAGRRGDVLLRRVRNARERGETRTPRSQGRRPRLRNQGGRAPRPACPGPRAETSTMVLLRGGLRDRRAFVAGRGRARERPDRPRPAPRRDGDGNVGRGRSPPRPRRPRAPDSVDSEDERAGSIGGADDTAETDAQALMNDYSPPSVRGCVSPAGQGDGAPAPSSPSPGRRSAPSAPPSRTSSPRECARFDRQTPSPPS